MNTELKIGDLIYYNGIGSNKIIDCGIIISIKHDLYIIKWFVEKNITHEPIDSFDRSLKKIS